MNKKEMKEALMNLVADFEEKRTSLWLISLDRIFTEESMKNIEDRITYDVATESDNGKKVYSNDTLRNAEIQRRLKEDEAYSSLKIESQVLLKDEMRRKTEITILEYKLRAMECIVKLEVGT